MRARVLVWASLVACAAFSPNASANEPPSLWQYARRPELEKHERAIETAEELVLQAHELRNEAALGGAREPTTARNLFLGARSLLEAADAAHSPDPRVRFLLGDVLARLHDDGRVVGVLEPALRAFPDAPGATEAWWQLAIGFARTERRDDEVEAYRHFLDREFDPSARQIALSNMAEAKMALFDLPSAIAGYREAIGLDPGPGGVLARWGLAVALDRSGDLLGALDEAKQALAVDERASSRLRSEDVFFVPDYDRYWYWAVDNMGIARASHDPEERRQQWEFAAANYERYLVSALSDDRWAPIARARRLFCEASARKVVVKKGSLTPRATDDAGSARPTPHRLPPRSTGRSSVFGPSLNAP